METIKKHFTLLAMLIALTVVLALTFIFPVPMTNGYVNFLEVGIYTTALLLGGPAGLIVGAISGGMLDLILGYPQWLVFSVLIHGGQGFIAGRWSLNKKRSIQLLFLILASIFMIVGYFLATTLLYTSVAGFASIIGNTIQNFFGIIVSLGLVKLLDKTNLIK